MQNKMRALSGANCGLYFQVGIVDFGLFTFWKKEGRPHYFHYMCFRKRAPTPAVLGQPV